MEAPPYSAAAVDVVRLPDGTSERDRVAVEEPLEIRIGGRPVAVTMRTPGHDEELALGFCLSEGLRPRRRALPDDLAANTVEVDAPAFDPARLQRSFYTLSSCGVCGKGALEAVAVEAPRVESHLRVPLALVVVAARPAARGAGGVRGDRRPARDGPLRRPTASSSACARTSAGTTRSTRSIGRAFGDGRLPLADARALRQRPAVVRARAEGGGRRLPDPRRGRRAVEPRGRARARPRHHALRLRPRRHARTSTPRRGGSRADGRPARRRREHALRLAEGARASSTARRSPNAPGGCSARRATSASPSASARTARAALRRCSTTAPTCARRSPASSPGCARRRHELAVVVPVDMPLLTVDSAARARRRVPRRRASRRRGPLPGAYRRTALRRSSERSQTGGSRCATRSPVSTSPSSTLDERCSST